MNVNKINENIASIEYSQQIYMVSRKQFLSECWVLLNDIGIICLHVYNVEFFLSRKIGRKIQLEPDVCLYINAIFCIHLYFQCLNIDKKWEFDIYSYICTDSFDQHSIQKKYQ